MEADEDNVVVESSNMEVPLTDQDTQVIITPGVSYNETYAIDQKVRPQLYLFVCEICQQEFTQQLKFFEHLKAHYEDMQHQSHEELQDQVQDHHHHQHHHHHQEENEEEVEEQHQHQQQQFDTKLDARTLQSNSGSNDMVGVVEDGIPNAEGEAMVHQTAFLNNEIGSIVDTKTAARIKVDRQEEALGKTTVCQKVLLSCPKCKRTFRREKTYQAHVEVCHKQELDEESANYEEETKLRAKVTKKGKVKSEVVVVEEIVEELIEDELGLDETMETIHDPLGDGHHIFDGEELLEEDELFSEDAHQCMFCDDAFPSKIKLETHLKKAHSDESPLNGSKAKKKRAVSQRRQDVLKCTQCQRIFNHRNSLVYHMRSHTGERPHQCEMCGKSFFATSALKVHMRLHSGEKPYKCENCGRNFRQWGDLKYHMISIHSDIRQYQCEFCGKDFARKYSLIVHRRIHTGERNYKCEFCNKCFRAASYLQNHRRIHTGEKPHACTICGKPFRVRSDMKRHMASHNREPHHGHSSSVAHQAAQNVQNVVTVSSISNSTPQQIITIGPQITQQIAQVVRAGNAIQVPVSTESDLQTTQQIALEDGNEVVITGDIVDGTPINITLTQDGLAAHSSLEAAAVATLQPTEIQEGVLYPNREGTLETVTIRESNTGTLYVWPVFMN